MTILCCCCNTGECAGEKDLEEGLSGEEEYWLASLLLRLRPLLPAAAAWRCCCCARKWGGGDWEGE